jgi:hypothetical protein
MRIMPKDRVIISPNRVSTQHKRAPRSSLSKAATLRDRAKLHVEVVIEDISRTGCRITSGSPLSVGSIVGIGIQGLGPQAGRVVRYDEDGYGCVFLLELDDEQVQTARTASALANTSYVEMRDRVRAEASTEHNLPVGEHTSCWAKMVARFR